MNARKIGLLFLFLAFGAVVETAWVVRREFNVGPAGCRVLRGRFYGPSFSFDQEAQRPLAAGARVEVENSFGGVRLLPGAPGEVRITLRKVVYRPTEKEAREFADRIELRAAPAGAGLRISTNRDELGLRDTDVGFETHWEIALPPSTPVKVTNEHGRVDASDVGRAEITSSYEPVRVERVAGDAILRTRHGEVAAAGVTGALDLQARFGDVQVRDVTGKAVLDVAHGDVSLSRTGAAQVSLEHGDLEAETVAALLVRAKHAAVKATGVGGPADVESSFDDVRLTRVEGDCRVKLSHGEVQATDVKGTLTVEASYNDVVLQAIGGRAEVKVDHGGVRAQGLQQGARITSSGSDVTLESFRGPVEVDAQRASVRLAPSDALTDALDVKASRGEIRLVVPAGSRFDLEASTSRGQVQVNVPGLTVHESSGTRVTGRLGEGGHPVRLVCETGDVTVEGRPASASREP